MKKKYLFIVFIFVSSIVSSQQIKQSFFIRNYKQSLSIKIDTTSSFILLSSYGKITNSIHSDISSYLFQGQESDNLLGLYFFPSRLYSVKSKRFFEPDPASQYHSPYLYVGADPVNYFDMDGNVGKPIIFYGESTGKGIKGVGTPWHIQSMKVEGVEAYYMPANILVSDMPPQVLREWNGNVFIQGHTFGHGPVVTEERGFQYPDAKLKFNGEGSFSKVWQGIADEEEYTVAEPEFIADRLINFSEKSGVPLKNITVDGCQSSKAAERIGNRLSERMEEYKAGHFKEELPEKIKVSGLKKGRYSHWDTPLGEKNTTFHNPPISEMQMSPLRPDHEFVKGRDMEGKYTSERYYVDGNGKIYPRIRGKAEFSDYANGRVPKNIKPFMDDFVVPY